MPSKTLTDIHAAIVSEFAHSNLSLPEVARWTNECLADLAPALRLEATGSISLVAGTTSYVAPTDVLEPLGARLGIEVTLLPWARLGDFAQPGVWLYGANVLLQDLSYSTGDVLTLYYYRYPTKVVVLAPAVAIDVLELFDHLPVVWGCWRHQQVYIGTSDAKGDYQKDYVQGRNVLEKTRLGQTERFKRTMPNDVPRWTS